MKFLYIWHYGLLTVQSADGAIASIAPWLYFTMIGLCAVAAYLLGSINSAVLISTKFYHDDIRQHGSRNAGMTNMLRTFGKKAAGLTLLFDALKALVAGIFAALLIGDDGIAISMLFCMIGHMFPVYFHFRGGKGVVVAAASLLLLDPLTFLVCILVFAVIVAGTKYVSLGSIMSALLFPLFYNRIAPISPIGRGDLPGAVATICSLFVCLLIVVMHRANIKRLLNGEESKIRLKKDPSAASDDEED